MGSGADVPEAVGGDVVALGDGDADVTADADADGGADSDGGADGPSHASCRQPSSGDAHPASRHTAAKAPAALTQPMRKRIAPGSRSPHRFHGFPMDL
ncbi:hypothetical protein [Streptomyces sp. NBC_00306]|uniref:hypothetical protein n=1 Tax=Streptomyces sp. NBC_00306 TaxID=2975708 RepID=UPI002E2C17E2|nr:hypothetical protein [Streptomyces sp. NBC_00306]